MDVKREGCVCVCVGGVQRGEGPLWGTGTIIKDSTAAST